MRGSDATRSFSAMLPALALIALGACSVLNGYEPLAGAGGAGGSGGAGEGGATGGGPSGTGGELPTCNDAACEAGSGDCMTCTCLQDLVCDCDPMGMGEPCRGGLCDAAGACVGCLTNADCGDADEVCDHNQCVEAGCTDAMHNGNETDVDCGGVDCAPCANSQGCMVPEDCESVHCSSGACLPCIQQSDCGDFLYCSTSRPGVCVPKKSNFMACEESYECESDNCQMFGNLTVCY